MARCGWFVVALAITCGCASGSEAPEERPTTGVDGSDGVADGDVPPTSPEDAETPMPRPPAVAGGTFCAAGGTARGGEQVSHTCMTADLATQRASDGTHVWVPGSLFVVAPRQ